MNWQSIFGGVNVLQDATQLFTAQDVILTLTLSFVLAVLIGYVYRATYRGTSYTQSYVQTLVLMAMVVAVIMLIIGSNIARAFTLVGALSIIRFRNAIKDTRDVGFIFFAMAAGMACGTRFYFLGIVATVTICLLILAMVRFDLFARPIPQQVLKIRLPGDMTPDLVLREHFEHFLNRYDLVAMETVQAGLLTELVYTVEMKQPKEAQNFLTALSQANNNNKVMLYTGAQEIDL
ncbi:MAG: DUF4956 domain-containing protein [Caldilineaceae bacterium]